MSAIKITSGMFSGGNLKGLPEILRGLAIDNAQSAFEALDQKALHIANETTGAVTLNFTPILVPNRTSESTPIPLTFWDMAADAVLSLQVIATTMNVVLERFGINQLQGALSPAVNTHPTIKDVRLIVDLDQVTEEHLNTGLQMSQLRDGMLSCAERLNDIRTVLGKERVGGKIGGVDRGGIQQLLIERSGGVGASEKEVVDFIVTFNANLSLITDTWNSLIGVSIPGYQVITDLNFDDGIIATPEFSILEPATDQTQTIGALFFSNLDQLSFVFREIEIQVKSLADKHATAYEEILTFIETPGGRSLTIAHNGFIDYHPEDVVDVENSSKIVGIIRGLTVALEGMVVPINNALMMNGYTPLVDVFGDTALELNVYVMPCNDLAKHIYSLWFAACNLATAIMRSTNIEREDTVKSLRVIAY